jgi:hypothetical protein
MDEDQRTSSEDLVAELEEQIRERKEGDLEFLRKVREGALDCLRGLSSASSGSSGARGASVRPG